MYKKYLRNIGIGQSGTRPANDLSATRLNSTTFKLP